jgi:hypothetical protein
VHDNTGSIRVGLVKERLSVADSRRVKHGDTTVRFTGEKKKV